MPCIKIVTLTGPSGSGKTSIVKELRALRPDLRLVVSLTTRAPRPSDLPGEYHHRVLPAAFKENPDFMWLWVVKVHGDFYGTLQSSVDDALSGETPSLMILAPEAVGTLRSYAEARCGAGALGKLLHGSEAGCGGGVASFYILAPPERELRKRLKQRGDDSAAIERRLADCKRWDEAACKSVIPYIFVSNEKNSGVQDAAQNILKYLD